MTVQNQKHNAFLLRKAEVEEKILRLLTFLEEQDYAAVYLKRQDNFAWLTAGGVNYVSLGELGNCGLLVTATGGRYAITNNIEGPRMTAEERLEDFGFEVLTDLWYHDGFEEKCLNDLIKGKLATDHSRGMGVNEKGALQALRYTLTANEVARYQIAGGMVSDLVERIALKMEQGMTELDFVAGISAAAIPLGITPTMVACAADERIDNFKHAVPTTKKIENRIQVGGNYRYGGLTVCLCRFVYFSRPTEEQLKMHRDNIEIDCSLMAGSKPGRSLREVLEIGHKAYQDRGWDKDFDAHHQGGSIGYQNRDERVSFDSVGVVAENQAFCWNPSLRGTKSEDTIIATSSGPLAVSRVVHFPSCTVNLGGYTFTRALPYLKGK